MRDLKKRFVQILVIEFDDLKDDIEQLIGESTRKEDQGITTPYVSHSNVAVFRNEERAIEQFIQVINQLDLARFENLDALIEYCRTAFHDKIRSCDLAPFIAQFADRKIQKVKAYITASEK